MLAAVKRYFVDHAGDFPRALSDLVPKYIKAIPEIQIPGYKKTNGVTVVTQMAGDDITGFLGDTGGFLYIAAPGARRGEVRIDSVKKYRGNPLYEY